MVCIHTTRGQGRSPRGRGLRRRSPLACGHDAVEGDGGPGASEVFLARGARVCAALVAVLLRGAGPDEGLLLHAAPLVLEPCADGLELTVREVIISTLDLSGRTPQNVHAELFSERSPHVLGGMRLLLKHSGEHNRLLMLQTSPYKGDFSCGFARLGRRRWFGDEVGRVDGGGLDGGAREHGAGACDGHGLEGRRWELEERDGGHHTGDAKPNKWAGRREPRLDDASTRPNNASRE